MTMRNPTPPVMETGSPASGRPSEARRVPSITPVFNCAISAPADKSDRRQDSAEPAGARDAAFTAEAPRTG